MRDIKFRSFVKKEQKMMFGRSAMAVKRFTPNYAYLDSEVELMQYTGLKDKNNKEIFESDIVKFSDYLTGIKSNVGQVGFMNGSFVIKGEVMTHYRWVDYEVEVIGNIYENPELCTA